MHYYTWDLTPTAATLHVDDAAPLIVPLTEEQTARVHSAFAVLYGEGYDPADNLAFTNLSIEDVEPRGCRIYTRDAAEETRAEAIDAWWDRVGEEAWHAAVDVWEEAVTGEQVRLTHPEEVCEGVLGGYSVEPGGARPSAAGLPFDFLLKAILEEVAA